MCWSGSKSDSCSEFDSANHSSWVNKSNVFQNNLRNIIFIESWPISSGRHGMNHWEWIVTEKVRIKRALPDLPGVLATCSYHTSSQYGSSIFEIQCHGHGAAMRWDVFALASYIWFWKSVKNSVIAHGSLHWGSRTVTYTGYQVPGTSTRGSPCRR